MNNIINRFSRLRFDVNYFFESDDRRFSFRGRQEQIWQRSISEAVREGDVNKVKSLAEKKVSFEKNFTAPFMEAVKKGHLKIVAMFFLNTTSIDKALWLAAENGQLEIVKFFVENNFSPLKLDTAIGRAAASGHLKVVRFLIEKGADTSTPNTMGILPLESAQFFKNYDVIDFLEQQI